MVINYIFFKRITSFVYIIHMYARLIRVNLATALIYRHKDRLYAGCGLCHQACSSRRGDCQACNVASPVFYHLIIQRRVSVLQSVYVRICLFPLGVVQRECATLLCHLDRRPVGRKCQRLVYRHRKSRSLWSSITEAHCGKHISFRCCSKSSASSSQSLVADFLPQIQFCGFNFFRFWIGLYFGNDFINFFHFQIDNVVHQSLSTSDVLSEKVKVKFCFGCERIFYV